MSKDTDEKKADSSPKLEFDDDVVMTFPQRLMHILNNDENHDAIAWLPHGKGFIIHNKQKFANKVMPRYFKQSKFTSFTRKMNRWGFVRGTARGPEMGGYYHKFFQRDEPTLCLRMSCEAVKVKPNHGHIAISLPSHQFPGDASMAMLQPAAGSQFYPPGLMGNPGMANPAMGNDATLVAQNAFLQQQLLLHHLQQERARSNMYLQMLQNQEASANAPMMNSGMLSPSPQNQSVADAAAAPLAKSAPTDSPVQSPAKEILKTEAV